jgi:transketolase
MPEFKRGPKARKPLNLHDDRVRELEDKAMEIREDIIDMLVEAGSGHSAGPLGTTEIFTALYFHIMEHKPDDPAWEDRDRLILSNGHIVPVRYVTMAHAGYFDKKKMMTLRKFGTELQGHPELREMKGVETTSGPLGSGSSQAVGIAYTGLMDGAPWRVYCVMSDGELEAGQTWEAMLFAGRNNLYNCTFIVDRNNIQIDGTTEDIMPLEPLKEKFESFNMNVERCAGNDIEDFVKSIARAQGVSEKPTVILADTIPGYGVDYMEYDFEWHGKPPAEGEESREAIQDLRTLGGRIRAEHE